MSPTATLLHCASFLVSGWYVVAHDDFETYQPVSLFVLVTGQPLPCLGEK
jgi:hypothetical protein